MNTSPHAKYFEKWVSAENFGRDKEGFVKAMKKTLFLLDVLPTPAELFEGIDQAYTASAYKKPANDLVIMHYKIIAECVLYYHRQTH